MVNGGLESRSDEVKKNGRLSFDARDTPIPFTRRVSFYIFEIGQASLTKESLIFRRKRR